MMVTMRTKMISSLSSFYLFFFVITWNTKAFAEDEITNKDIRWWCATTPHPDTCNHFQHRLHPKTRQDFLTITIRAAMEEAVEAHSNLASPNITDCHHLIHSAIHQLNTTLQTTIQTSPSHDIQTWLSAALTDVDLCAQPLLTANASKLISNSLSINAHRSSSAETGGRVAGRMAQDLGSKSKADAVVAQDGSGGFLSIQEAINYAVANRVGSGRVVVYVKKGVYEENVVVNRTMERVTLIGDGVRHTVITGNRSASDGYTTYSSATVGIDGSGFIARGITFRNTAGPEAGQAVALRSASDLSVFYACSFEGYQDTLFAHSQRQFYKSCYIYGTVDIIFGNAAVVLQNCVIYVRKPLLGQANMVTAQGRGDPFQNTGISIHSCRIMAAPDLKPVVDSVKTYLGRPWQQYSRTVVIKTYLDGFVDPQGWSRWGDTDFALSTLYYGEYRNFGPGAATENRVQWPGFHNMTVKETVPFTAANLIAGRQWLPATGVPFSVNL